MRHNGRKGMVALLLALAPALAFAVAAAEESGGTVIVRARNGAAPIPLAHVSADGLLAETDERGEARVSLQAGEHSITVSRPGFAPVTLQVTVRAGVKTTVTVQLQEQRMETEVVVVSATRS